MLEVALNAAIAFCGGLTLIAGHRKWRAFFVLKPATTVLILAVPWLAAGTHSEFYRWAVTVGLTFSLAGDVFLMWPQHHFVKGLVCFLVAHVCYAVAFWSPGVWPASLGRAVPFAVVASILCAILAPGLGPLKGPVAVYAAALSVMAWQAAERACAGAAGGSLACPGALLFLLSDSVLALDRFRWPFRWAEAVVLATYYAAQWLIATSAG